MNKQGELDRLYEEYRREFEGEEIVTGDGSVDSKVLLIGEAPGKDEVRLQRPFVGMAGKNLDEFLEILKVDRREIYITNAIKYRLSKVNPKTGRKVNRPATKKEMDNNRSYLLKEIDIIKPGYIVTLGNVPLKVVSGQDGISIGDVHGGIEKIIIEGKEYLLFPLYHPASIIYNRSLKDVYVSDLNKFKDIVHA